MIVLFAYILQTGFKQQQDGTKYTGLISAITFEWKFKHMNPQIPIRIEEVWPFFFYLRMQSCWPWKRKNSFNLLNHRIQLFFLLVLKMVTEESWTNVGVGRNRFLYDFQVTIFLQETRDEKICKFFLIRSLFLVFYRLYHDLLLFA